ncbi:unnamed protein product (macronuclear) [Paramecium tetraurelia]|uniref:glutathione transferase n=1 Tax=Paramecium tetraurelia TaxID=5888 RepID=A0EF30_PARTE|nr:uncharacterized protein GSPATT00026244001 [Paramecium tetraurelia]CAK93921.1 unnamed protein product [Paramecium tetraurelia]|eukprot:XP_001461294.1 hypothetical protein (macronuclear) [Paramecium tetraurelia strain d4-2]
MQKFKHTLVTFKLCPYSMRVLALMCYKNIKFEIKFIEMYSKPEWFLKISPLARVPILIIGDDIVLFESDAIMEYIDEMTPPQIMPSDPIQKALDRGKFEYASEIMKNMSIFVFSQEEEKFFKHKELLKTNFEQVEKWLQDKKFMNGEQISLVDFCFIPIFVNLSLFKPVIQQCELTKNFTKFNKYGENLLQLPCSKAGRVPDYELLVVEGVRKVNSYLYRSNPCFFKSLQQNSNCQQGK